MIDLMLKAGTRAAFHLKQTPLQEGATALEYALIAGLIAAVIVGAVAALGTQVVALFQAAVNAPW